MTDTIFDQNLNSSDMAYSSSADGDTVEILPNVYVYSTYAGFAAGTFRLTSSATLTNYGSIVSNTGEDYSASVYVGAYTKTPTIINYGSIINNSTFYSSNISSAAIQIFDGATTVQNYGTISGRAVGILNYGQETAIINNNGDISGGIVGVSSIYTAATILTNNGHIFGGVDFTDNYITNDQIVNAGTIFGNVDVGRGSDIITNTYGVITGNITGGLGDDTINGGAQRDVIFGDDLSSTNTGGGNDSLFGFYGDDVIHGGFGNDTIQGNQGNDVLYGDAGNDFLHGGQDSDQLFGGDGNDILNGGLGADVLTGGAGDDRFVYALNFGHDTITDFSAVSGNNDVIQFQAGTFANYADVQSHMEQQGANVVIELNVNDSLVLANTTTAALTSDHFIFG